MRQATRDLLFARCLDIPGNAQGREQPDEDKPWIVTHYAFGFVLGRDIFSYAGNSAYHTIDRRAVAIQAAATGSAEN
jgi:hypothetical protein